MYTRNDKKKPGIALNVLISASILFTYLSSSSTWAHPIEYHMRPLDAAINLLWSIQQAMIEADVSGALDNPYALHAGLPTATDGLPDATAVSRRGERLWSN
jgi:hypothetical protein